MDTRSFLLSRPVRVSIDVVFLAMAGIWAYQDARSDDRSGMILWGAFTVFWVVMLVLDAVRTPRGARALEA
jgi:hypothetical protein